MIYAPDTNIVSYYLKGYFNFDDTIKRILLEKRDGLAIPPFTLFETLRGLYAAKATVQIQNFNALCEQCIMGEIRREDWIAGAKLYAHCNQSGRPTSDADLMQAAFCIRRNYTLVTHNTKHFEHIPGLSLADWSVGL
jgi:predicted nucleic acid-binding protein